MNDRLREHKQQQKKLGISVNSISFKKKFFHSFFLVAVVVVNDKLDFSFSSFFSYICIFLRKLCINLYTII